MIAYKSRTGNVKYIVSKLKLPSCEIDHDLVMNEPYILFTYTDGLGETPKIINEFLSIEENVINLKGVIASGNTNFGKLFCNTANEISEKFNVPIVRKIDLRGTDEDVKTIEQQYKFIIEGE